MFSKKFQLVAMNEFLKSLYSPTNLSIESKIFSVIAYIAVIGGKASEYNTLSLLEFANVDMDDEHNLLLTQNLLSFYCGVGVIDITSNGLGVSDILKNPNMKSFQKGQKSDSSNVTAGLTRIQKNLIDDIIAGSEAYDKEKDRILNLP